MTNILVVDDAVDAAELLALLFSTLGHESHVAFDGEQGVAAARRHRPHIIFLDLDMPRLDGFGAAHEIRHAPDTGNPFIVALTAKTGPGVKAQTEAAGFDFYLAKPADTNVLISLVDDLQSRTRPTPPLGD